MAIYLGCWSPSTSSDVLGDVRRAAGVSAETIPICLAPSGVYLAGTLPPRWWALTPPLHPRLSEERQSSFLWH